VLVITKEAESQTERLSKEDFKAALTALKTLDEAFMYYNAGTIAGCSQ
jgi:ATP adenylyltransferase/5',5'''-P-1,P-4-tetraphosphate phosphorylase II